MLSDSSATLLGCTICLPHGPGAARLGQMTRMLQASSVIYDPVAARFGSCTTSVPDWSHSTQQVARLSAQLCTRQSACALLGNAHCVAAAVEFSSCISQPRVQRPSSLESGARVQFCTLCSTSKAFKYATIMPVQLFSPRAPSDSEEDQKKSRTSGPSYCPPNQSHPPSMEGFLLAVLVRGCTYLEPP